MQQAAWPIQYGGQVDVCTVLWSAKGPINYYVCKDIWVNGCTVAVYSWYIANNFVVDVYCTRDFILAN